MDGGNNTHTRAGRGAGVREEAKNVRMDAWVERKEGRNKQTQRTQGKKHGSAEGRTHRLVTRSDLLPRLYFTSSGNYFSYRVEKATKEELKRGYRHQVTNAMSLLFLR